MLEAPLAKAGAGRKTRRNSSEDLWIFLEDLWRIFVSSWKIFGGSLGVATSNSFGSLPEGMENISDQCYENGKMGSYSEVVKGKSLWKYVNHLKNDGGKTIKCNH